MFEKIFIIAEAGINHNGNLDTAIELIHKAKESQADAIKFQDLSLHSLFAIKEYERVLGLKDKSWQNNIIPLSFKSEWHEIISKEAFKTNITYFSTPYSLEAVDLLDPWVPFYKVASGDITYTKLLEKIGMKKKGIFISSGSSYIDEIDNAINTLNKYNLPFICIMHCIMLYPAPVTSLNLNFIDTLKNRYNLPVGFSDHTSGIDSIPLIVGKGVKVIEKHFTLDSNQEGCDHRHSLNPVDFKKFVDKIRLCEMILGSKEKVITEKEKMERTYARRGIYAKKDIKKGEKITFDKITFLRPNVYIGAEKVNEIVGKIVKDDIIKGAPLKYSMVY